MTSVGVDRRTFRPLVGWPHTVQCIGQILTTELGSRVERRDFGSLIPRLVDKPQNEESIVNFYMATVEALEPRRRRNKWYGVPTFSLDSCRITAHTPGEIGMALIGTEFPNGHKGDFSRASPREIVYSANRLSDIIEYKAVG